MESQFVYAFLIGFFSLILNLIAIGFLFGSKILRQSRFRTLVLCLSISDCSIVVQYVILSIFQNFDKGTDITIYGCMIMKHSLVGTLCFSAWQTTMICLEVLKATYQCDVKILKRLTSNRSIGVSFIVCQLYTTVPLIYEITQGMNACDVTYTLRLSFILSMDVPLFCYYMALVFLYGVVVVRMVKLIKLLSTDTSMDRKKWNVIKRMKMNMITLGVIIAVTSLAVLPREIMSVVSMFMEDDEHMTLYALIGNGALLLNPLLDPVIYVLCIKVIRRKVTSCCRRKRVVPLEINMQPGEQQNVRSTNGRLFVYTVRI